MTYFLAKQSLVKHCSSEVTGMHYSGGSSSRRVEIEHGVHAAETTASREKPVVTPGPAGARVDNS